MRVIYDDGTVRDFGDEPVFILRGKDAFTLGTLVQYTVMCRREHLNKQEKEVNKAVREIREWQSANKDKVKLPDHEHQPVGQRTALQKEGAGG